MYNGMLVSVGQEAPYREQLARLLAYQVVSLDDMGVAYAGQHSVGVVVATYATGMHDCQQQLIDVAARMRQAGVGTLKLVIGYVDHMRMYSDQQGPSDALQSLLNTINETFDAVLCIEPHRAAVTTLLSIPHAVLPVGSLLLETLLADETLTDFWLVAPDFGARERVQAIAQKYSCAWAWCTKTRTAEGVSIQLAAPIPADIPVIIIDDLIDTGRTAGAVAQVLARQGNSVYVCVTHAVGKQWQQELKDVHKIIMSNSLLHESSDLTYTICLSRYIAQWIGG